MLSTFLQALSALVLSIAVLAAVLMLGKPFGRFLDAISRWLERSDPKTISVFPRLVRMLDKHTKQVSLPPSEEE
jgi:hypothetical protein